MFWKCAEPLTAIAGCCISFAFGGPDLGVKIGAAVGGAGLLALVNEAVARHGPESRAALARVRRRVRYRLEQLHFDDRASQAQIVRADALLARALPQCLFDRPRHAASAGDATGFLAATTRLILNGVAAIVPEFASDDSAGEIPRMVARAVIEATLIAAMEDQGYFAKLQPHLLTALAQGIGTVRDTVEKIDRDIALDRLRDADNWARADAMLRQLLDHAERRTPASTPNPLPPIVARLIEASGDDGPSALTTQHMRAFAGGLDRVRDLLDQMPLARKTADEQRERARLHLQDGELAEALALVDTLIIELRRDALTHWPVVPAALRDALRETAIYERDRNRPLSAYRALRRSAPPDYGHVVDLTIAGRDFVETDWRMALQCAWIAFVGEERRRYYPPNRLRRAIGPLLLELPDTARAKSFHQLQHALYSYADRRLLGRRAHVHELAFGFVLCAREDKANQALLSLIAVRLFDLARSIEPVPDDPAFPDAPLPLPLLIEAEAVRRAFGRLIDRTERLQALVNALAALPLEPAGIDEEWGPWHFHTDLERARTLIALARMQPAAERLGLFERARLEMRRYRGWRICPEYPELLVRMAKCASGNQRAALLCEARALVEAVITRSPRASIGRTSLLAQIKQLQVASTA